MSRKNPWSLVALAAFTCFCFSAFDAFASDDNSDSVRALFYGVHDKIDQDTTDGAIFHGEVLNILKTAMVEQPEHLHNIALLSAMEVANRLESRGALLTQISNLGYSHNFQSKNDTVHASWVFCLGIIEHARADMDAAEMWFDSTLTFLERGVEHESIAAATKLLGFLERDRGNYAAATKRFEQTRKLFNEWGAAPAELIDIESSWASTAIRSGHDHETCYQISKKAVDRLDADSLLLKRWTYAYLIYLNHSIVLNVMGLTKEAEEYATRSVEFCRARGDNGSRAFVQLKLAEMQVAAKEYARATKSLEECIPIFVMTNQLDHLVEAYGYFETIYEAKGDYAKSLENARKGRDAGLLLSETRRADQLLAVRKDFSVANAEREVLLAQEIAARAELEKEKATSNQYALLAGFLCVGLLLLVTIQRLRYRSQKHDELERQVASRTAELAAKTKRLEASNQELEKFAYIASHDMKTPLRNVTSFLGLIQLRLPENARPIVGEYVELAQDYARSMHSLVTDVLEFSKINVDLIKLSRPFNLRSLCDKIVKKRSRDLAESGAQITVLGSALLIAPATFIEQVIGNLVDNALKYNEAEVARVSIEICEEEDEVKIIVSDNGLGIAEEYQSKVFELFKRLHTSDKYLGTGLGLSTSKKIVERLGGCIELNSELGKGSVFTVTLPKSVQGERKLTPVSTERASAEAHSVN